MKDTGVDLLAVFETEMRYRGCSEETLGWYRRVYQRLLSEGGGSDRAAITRFIVAARGRGLSPATLKNYDRALRGLFNFWHRQGYLTENPMQGLPRPKGFEPQVEPFSRQDIGLILDEARASQLALRNTALILLLLDTGMRAGEISSLTLRDIRWGEGLLRVNGKTGERLVPFGARAHRALQAYLSRERQAPFPDEEHVFLSGGRQLQPQQLNVAVTRLVRKAGITRTKVGPHTFRHTFAISYLRAGGDVFTLQRILGHRKLEITQRYVALVTSDLQAAHRKFSPVDRL